MAAMLGDETNVANMDQLVQLVCLRNKSVAKNFKLKQGSPILGACDDAITVRAYLVKCLKDIFGDDAKSFFGNKKWQLHDTRPDGTCGFEARAIIAGVADPRNTDAYVSDAFSHVMQHAWEQHNYSTDKPWLDTVEMIQDVIQEDARFNGSAFWIRAVASMDDDHKKCNVIVRANQFKIDGALGVPVPVDAGAWPLAATPIEPPQPCRWHLAARRTHPQRRARSPQRVRRPLHHLHVRDYRLHLLQPAIVLGEEEGRQQCAPHPGLREQDVCLASTLVPRSRPDVLHAAVRSASGVGKG